MNAGFLQVTNRRGLMLAPIACLVMIATGCVATKQDVRTLELELASIRAQQDSLYREIVRQNSILTDSVRGGSELTRRLQGQLSNEIRQLRETMTSMQQLLGQTQQQINRQIEELRQSQGSTPAPPAPSPSNVSAEELYSAGATKLQEKSVTAARLAFEQFLTQYPQHERAPDAQFGLAETYALEEELADAVEQFVRVAEAYPTSGRAPEALFRAGELSEARERTDDARTYSRRVVQRYANAPSARLAQQRLNRLR